MADRSKWYNIRLLEFIHDTFGKDEDESISIPVIASPKEKMEVSLAKEENTLITDE